MYFNVNRLVTYLLYNLRLLNIILNLLNTQNLNV